MGRGLRFWEREMKQRLREATQPVGRRAQIHMHVYLTPKSRLTAPSQGDVATSHRPECLEQPGLSAGCAPDIKGCKDAEEGGVKEGFLEMAAFDLTCALTLLPPQSLFPQPEVRGSRCPCLWAVSSWK